MSDDHFEPINDEPTTEDILRAQVAKLQSDLALSQKLEVGLRERLLLTTVELETIKELYEESLRERINYRIQQRHLIRNIREEAQQSHNAAVAELQRAANDANQLAENARSELSEVLDKFARVKTLQRDAERSNAQLDADIVWLLALLHSGFQIDEIVGRQITQVDIETARNRSLVLPSKLTRGKIKQLLS
jgi:hypothetical protein